MSKAEEGFHCGGLAVQLDCEQSFLLLEKPREERKNLSEDESRASTGRRHSRLCNSRFAEYLVFFPAVFSRKKKERLLAVYAVPKLRVRT